MSNKGDADRIVVAQAKFLQVLASDLRIIEQYRMWLAFRAEIIRRGPPKELLALPFEVAQVEKYRALAVARDVEITKLVAPTLRGMGIPWSWCARDVVVKVFETAFHCGRHPEDRKPFVVELDVTELSQGRAPRNQGRDIERNVEWFYRARIKNPKDSISELAREYESNAGRMTDGRSVVQNGIAQAEALLELRRDKVGTPAD